MIDDSEILYVPVDDLDLDTENPRLPEGINRDQHEMINYIATSTSIEELMSAIAENGFFPGEPLIVIPHETEAGRYIVVEGNRRLSAVKLLRDPFICDSPSSRLKFISDTAKHKVERVPVIKRNTRLEILPYLGFRHITGVKQWEPLSKARYIKQLFDYTDAKLDPMLRYYEVSRAIGSRRDHIKRNLDALAVYEIIKNNDFYNIDKLDEESIKFAVLSTALADERLGQFVGVSKEDDGDTIPCHPIIDSSVLKHKEIKEITEWLYKKDEDKKTRVGESRNLRELAAVVNSPKALEQFRMGASLNVAYQLTSDVTKDFLHLLYQVEALLIDASGMVATVEYDRQAHEVARRINKHIKLIGSEIAEKNSRGDDDF